MLGYCPPHHISKEWNEKFLQANMENIHWGNINFLEYCKTFIQQFLSITEKRACHLEYNVFFVSLSPTHHLSLRSRNTTVIMFLSWIVYWLESKCFREFFMLWAVDVLYAMKKLGTSQMLTCVVRRTSKALPCEYLNISYPCGLTILRVKNDWLLIAQPLAKDLQDNGLLFFFGYTCK